MNTLAIHCNKVHIQSLEEYSFYVFFFFFFPFSNKVCITNNFVLFYLCFIFYFMTKYNLPLWKMFVLPVSHTRLVSSLKVSTLKNPPPQYLRKESNCTFLAYPISPFYTSIKTVLFRGSSFYKCVPGCRYSHVQTLQDALQQKASFVKPLACPHRSENILGLILHA